MFVLAKVLNGSWTITNALRASRGWLRWTTQNALTGRPSPPKNLSRVWKLSKPPLGTPRPPLPGPPQIDLQEVE